MGFPLTYDTQWFEPLAMIAMIFVVGGGGFVSAVALLYTNKTYRWW